MRNADLTLVGQVIRVDNGIAGLDMVVVGDDSGDRHYAEISMRKLSHKGITDGSFFRVYVYAKSQ